MFGLEEPYCLPGGQFGHEPSRMGRPKGGNGSFGGEGKSPLTNCTGPNLRLQAVLPPARPLPAAVGNRGRRGSGLGTVAYQFTFRRA